MENITKYTVPLDSKIIDVLRVLEDLSYDSAMAVFVVDAHSKIVGTITAGDIRRALIRGCELSEQINTVMNKNFFYLREDYFDLEVFKQIREKELKLVPIINENKRIVRILNFQKQKSYLPIDAVLMAGGKGERLRPLTEKIPKPLLKVGNKAIIDYNIDSLLDNSVENIHITVNYLSDQVEAHFALPRKNGVCIKCVREPKYLGTMGSIKFVENWHNDSILVMNSDLFTNINLEDFFFHFIEHDADMSIAAIPYSVNIPYGILDIENKRDVIGVREKPSYHYYANAGIYLIKRKMIDLIPDGEFFNATDLIQKLIESNKKVIRFPLSGYWIDIGNPEDFKKAHDLANHIQR